MDVSSTVKLSNLPPEIRSKICSYLQQEDRKSLSRVCESMHDDVSHFSWKSIGFKFKSRVLHTQPIPSGALEQIASHTRGLSMHGLDAYTDEDRLQQKSRNTLAILKSVSVEKLEKLKFIGELNISKDNHVLRYVDSDFSGDEESEDEEIEDEVHMSDFEDEAAYLKYKEEEEEIQRKHKEEDERRTEESISRSNMHQLRENVVMQSNKEIRLEICKFVNLTVLNVSHAIFCECRNIFPHLVELHAHHVTDESLKCISTLESLCILSIGSSGKISDVGIKSISNLKRIAKLDISTYKYTGNQTGFVEFDELSK